MNPKNTWIWLIIAGGLFAAIFILERTRPAPPGPILVLPGFKAAAVSSVTVRPAGEMEIRAERTNDSWRLTRPIVYPAQAASIEVLLKKLEELMQAKYLTAADMRQHPNADEEFGLNQPQATLEIHSADTRRQLRLGAKTAPGDQVFVEVVGAEGVYVVDAELLRLLPRTTNDWRDTALVGMRDVLFDRILVTNAAGAIELHFDPTNRLWSMARPVRSRADNDRINEALTKLATLRVARFVSDIPEPDLDSFGLQSPDLSIALSRGTNVQVSLQFGKNPPNEPGQVFARQAGLSSIVAVAAGPLALWRAAPNDFRDRRLLPLTQAPDQIEFRGNTAFSLNRLSNNVWRVVGQGFPVDAGLVQGVLVNLSGMQILKFMDTITEPELPALGLAPPAQQIVLRAGHTNGTATNTVIGELSFGAPREDRIAVRRADESAVYEVKLSDYLSLPVAAWQLRERRIWNFSENDVARLTIRQDGRQRQINRTGTNSWALAPGSQGIINDLAVESMAQSFGALSATLWVQPDGQDLARFGFTTNGLSLTFDLKNGEKPRIEFGGVSSSDYPYAAVPLEGQTWVFEFPIGLYRLATNYLAIPPETP